MIVIAHPNKRRKLVPKMMTEDDLKAIESALKGADPVDPKLVEAMIAEVRRLQERRTFPLYAADGRFIGTVDPDPESLAERDALLAENQRLREALTAVDPHG